MFVLGLSLLVITAAALWLCQPGKNKSKKPFLRGGLDTLAGIAITAGLGVGIALTIIGLG